MAIQERLMQKHGLVATLLAQEWFAMKQGDRIGTVDEYVRKFSAGRGTVQTAVKLLAGSGAVTLEAKGHLGTYLAAVDYELLWEYTGFGAVMGVMPLPYSRLYEGLATGLYQEAREGGLPFNLAYMRGAETRLQALADGRYDFAIASRLAAETALTRGMELEIAMTFGPRTYVNQHVWVFAPGKGCDICKGMRVAVDRSSIDHYQLTMEQCQGLDVAFIDLPYNQIIARLQKGDMDAAVWNVDEILERQVPLEHCPLKNPDHGDKATEAVLLVRQKDRGLQALLTRVISKEKVVENQQLVVAGKLVPGY